MVRVAREAVTDDLGIDIGSRLGVFRFEQQ
jgi:hypothetical protein